MEIWWLQQQQKTHLIEQLKIFGEVRFVVVKT